jgi:malto-oligosyltrehalose trehalohydrolase
MNSAPVLPRQPRHGPLFLNNGVLFRVWAPSLTQLQIDVNGRIAHMERGAGGHFFYLDKKARPGENYAYIVGGKRMPDYASRAQPFGVHGESQLVQLDPSNRPRFRGRPPSEIIDFELHAGTFTHAGTFNSLREMIPRIADAGFTNIQIMPTAASPGKFGWGYEGTHLFAPDPKYGTPQELAGLIDAVHRAELTIIQDVVYNHFGPDGNYIPIFAKQFFDNTHTTWGAAIDFEGPENQAVRDFYHEHADYLINALGFDGLRFDATHCIPRTFMMELTSGIRASISPGRHIWLIAENEEYPPELLARDAHGKPRYLDAFTDDRFHHPARILGSGISEGYYNDYADNPIGHLARSLTQSFGDAGRKLNIPQFASVISIETHDQRGNTPKGIPWPYRDPEDYLILQTVAMLSPKIPLVFQTEMIGPEQPFSYFCGHDGELAQMERDGRQNEFGDKFPSFRAEHWLDPNDRATFHAAKMKWNKAGKRKLTDAQAKFKNNTAARLKEITPLLAANSGWQSAQAWDDNDRTFQCTWRFTRGEILQITGNLSHQPVALPEAIAGKLIGGNEVPDDRTVIMPKSVHVCLTPAPSH